MPFCNACGANNKSDAKICTGCGKLLTFLAAEQKYENMVSSGVPRARRITAAGIDFLIFAAIMLFLFTRKGGPLILLFERNVAVFVQIAYFLLKDGFEGKSFGKVITGIVVLNQNKRRAANILDSVFRNWYLALPILGPLVFGSIIAIQLLSGKRERLGDAIARTVVVTDEEFLKLV